ncbi:class II aldolase/adducin family protein [Oceanobacillus jeddahense]|uniref:Class II aldolase/adducin family protein n=1 Tax=Oceanobacillus jeddahense TaxID=1462527 RepID=A0ABY5JRT2_9BACI|nr:class II aldolase/adducin family protein [Oceanobacillus jeddahense]UUI03006.1 class II aldolase/adducin family protein [Oceanobacillus jeddahense]
MSIQREVVKIAKQCYETGLVVGTAGNVSVRKGNIMYITPSALPYNEMTEEDVLEVDLTTGEIVKGHRKPSSETPMHTNIYLQKEEIKAIVHTHSTYATMFACAHKPIPPVHYVIADIGREVSVAPYARYGSESLAKYAVATLGDANGVLLANHGVVAVGDTLADAYRRAEAIEEVALLAYGSHALNSVNPLTEENLDEALEGFKTYTSN